MGEKNFLKLAVKAKNLFLYDVAIKYLEQAAELGNSEAMYLLGDIFANDYYYFGHLFKDDEQIKTDDVQALKWYKRAADNGLGKAFIEVAVLSLNEEQYNSKQAEKFFKAAITTYKSLSGNGNIFAMKTLAEIYEKYYFAESLNTGYERKNSRIGTCYKMAFSALKKLADRGNIEAKFQISDMVRCGKGTDENIEQSIAILKSVAEIAKNSDDKITAYRKIAEIILSEYETKTSAINFYKQAAALGDFISMRELWKIYELGKVVKKNLSESQKWLKKSEELQKKFFEEIRL